MIPTGILVTTITLLVAGYLISFSRHADTAAHWLNTCVINIALPALILSQLSRLDVSELSVPLIIPVAVQWIALICAALLVLIAHKIFRFNRETLGALLLLVPLGNTSFLGLPMVKAFFGNAGVPYAIFYDQFGSFIALTTYGTLIATRFGNQQEASIHQTIKKILTFPPFLSLVIALMIGDYHYPKLVDIGLDVLGQMLLPMAMLAVGIQLQWKLTPNDLKAVIVGLLIKLGLTPLLVWGFLLLLSTATESEKLLAMQVSLFQAAMPPMISAAALASTHSLNPRLCAALVGMGILLSFVTLLGWFHCLSVMT